MNTLNAIILTTLALVPTLGRAAEVQSFIVTKGQQLQQTNASSAVLDTNNSPHRFFSSVEGSASNSVLGVTLKLPNATNRTFTNEDGGFMLEQAFTNSAQLDSAYGTGTYAFTILTLTGATNRPTLALSANAYPTAPRVANWQDAQTIEASLPFTLYWDPIATGTTNDFVKLEVEDTGGEPVASSPDLLQPGALNGTNGSAIIPADALSENQTYNARLLFVKRTSVNTTNIPGATGFAGFYRQTAFPLATLPSAPEGGRVQFSASAFAATEDAGDTLVVTVSRTGSEAAMNVQVGMVDGTATSGLDYLNSPALVNFAEGAQTAVVAVPIPDDYLLEGNETVNLALSSPSLGTLGPRSNAVFTIVDNELPSAGKIQFTTKAFAFAEAAGIAKVTLTRVGGSTGAVSVAYHTVSGTATSDTDFTATNGIANFASGQVTNTIVVRLNGDALDETNELFWVILDSTTGGAAFGTNLEATVTITDDDTAGLVAFKSATYTTNENTSSALITVARSGGTAANVTVDFATANGTATGGIDYFPTNGTITFGSNELTKTFSVGVINDFDTETNETILLSLSNPTGGAKIGLLTNATLRIMDEESSFSFTNATYTIGEAGPSISINILRTGSLTTTSAVTFATANVGAVSTNDYRGTNGTFVFPLKTKLKTLIIPIVNDTFVESNETFTVTLSNPLNGAQLGSIPVTTVTITNNDFGGVVYFSTNNYSATENATNAILTLSRTNGLASAVSVDVTASNGSAEDGVDYSNTTQTVTFNAGETSKKVFLPILNDTIDETNETVFVALSNPQGGGSLGARTNATLAIVDNDSGGVIAFKSATFTTNENSSFFTVIIARTNGIASNVTAEFTTEHGSAHGDDYDSTNGVLSFAPGETNKTVLVQIHDDTLPEGNETLSMLLSNPTGGATLGAISNSTLVIRDDESSVAFSNATYTVSEAGTNVSLTVIRSGALITPVTVQFSTLNDSAISTNDYRGTNGTLNFATNVSSLTIKVPIVNDTIVEDPETFEVSLHTPTGGLQLGTQTNVTVTITDNDLGGAIFFSTNSYSVNENGTNATITLNRTNGLASGVTVKLNTDDGTADHDADYSNATQIVTFAAGDTAKKVLVPIINDTLDETNETVLLSLENADGGASLGALTTAQLTIVDNDTAGVISFKSAAQSTNENATNFIVTVVRSGGLASGVTVDYRTQDGTADHNSDFTEANQTLTFAAGETNKTFPVFITNDSSAEGSETLTVFLSDATGSATLGAITNTTLTIVDDESSISISNVTATVSEGGTNVVITLVRSGALLTSVSVDFTTLNGTAISTNDYRGTNGTVTFPANTPVKTFIIPIVNDTVVEGNETFQFRISNPQGGVQLGTTTNETVTITDNDLGGTIKFGAASFNGVEGSNAIVTITRTDGTASGVTVQFTISGGTAISGTDYTNVSGTITFNAGETNKKVNVPIVMDGSTESTETANLFLSNVTGGANLGAPTNAVLNLTDKPDPNAVPLTGPDFLSGKFGSTSFTAMTVGASLFPGGNMINIVASWGTTSPNLLTIDPTPFVVGTIQMSNSGNGGTANYGFGIPPNAHAYSVADGSSSVGSFGTVIFDGIDTVNHVVSGRFTFHMRETTDTVAPNGGFVDMTGSFRCHYNP